MNGLRDINGRKVYPGDLLRSFHFRAGRRRQKFYLYHVVVEEGEYLYAVPACYLNPSTKQTGGKYLLTASTIEMCKPEIIEHGAGTPFWADRERVSPPPGEIPNGVEIESAQAGSNVGD